MSEENAANERMMGQTEQEKTQEGNNCVNEEKAVEDGSNSTKLVITEPKASQKDPDGDNIVGILNGEPTIAERPSALVPFLLSCFVTIFCCFFVGLIAFGTAMYAGTREVHSEYRKMLTLSKRISIAGIIIGLIMIAVIVIAVIFGTDLVR